MAEEDKRDFHIVGVGASAGGLEALEKFFSNMPADGGVAFVVVQHLSPDYKSHMVELLSKYTRMPVYEVEDGMGVEPNAVYLLPRRKNMTIFKGKLYLVDYDRTQGLNLPIDIFFESLAKDQAEKAIGVILSGTGSDGTRGIQAIKEVGGMVMAQDNSAQFDGMPHSAIATRLVDYIAPPEKMPDSILRYVKHTIQGTDPHLTPAIANDDTTMNKLFAVLQQQTAVDFTEYKPSTIVRRIERRMNINQIDRLEDYVTYLQRSVAECRALYKEFLIGVTRFFRDPEAFEFLQEKILPVIFNGKKPSEQMRVWVTGCATGEEAYSLAILLQEYMEQTGQYLDVKIFATDLDKESLEQASLGIYPESIVADVAPERLQNYFIKKGNTFEILPRLRTMVVFAHQNLVKDPPFSRMDLISCRNLLIYMQPKLQKKVLDTFQFSLRSGGCLFLGSSESIGDYADDFQSQHHKWKIYLYHGAKGSLNALNFDKSRVQAPVKVQGYQQSKKKDDWRSSDSVLRSLVEQAMPPCVVVDENFVVVHAFGSVSQYLKVPIGYRVNLDILKMTREELSIPLSTALHRTKQEQTETIYQNINLKNDHNTLRLNLVVRPFWDSSSNQRLSLIIFDEQPSEENAPKNTEEFNISQSVNQRMKDLEQELQYTKENLQATIEELETANEELQATNEELMASNEELQSTNEELQSVNEEMLTVNTEYQMKIRELVRLNNDMDNLLSSTNIGTIFLDADLHVRKFTPAAQANVNLLDQDVGRPFSHLAHNFIDVNFYELTQEVLENLNAVEQEVQNKDGRWYTLKVMPYRTHHDQVDGIVIIMVDITDLKLTEEALQESKVQYALATQSDEIGIWEYAPDTGKVVVDTLTRKLLGYKDNSKTKTLEALFCNLPEDDRIKFSNLIERSLNNGSSGFEIEHRVIRSNKAPRWMRVSGIIIRDGDENPANVVGLITDITEYKQAENKLQLFEKAISVNRDGIVIIDHHPPDHSIVYANSGFEALTGYSADEIVGQSFHVLENNDHSQIEIQKLTHAMQSGKECRATLRNYRKDGTLFMNELTVYPLKDSKETITHFVGILRDVTERDKQQQPAVSQSGQTTAEGV